MLFNFGLISSFLLASAVLAHPPHDREHHLSTRDETSRNWAGAEYLGEGDGSFTTVTATFHVPSITKRGYFPPFEILASLDGITCSDVYLRVGLDVTSDENGNPSHKAWYEWHPDIQKQYLDDISVSAGDKITILVASADSGHGVAIVQNHTKNQIVGEQLNSAHAICGRDAMLVVAPKDRNVLVAKFSTVEFKDVKAYTIRDLPVTHFATLVNLKQHGKIRARASNERGSILVKCE